MKRMKKIFSLLLAVVLLLGCSVTSLADSAAKHIITITSEKAGHVYEAYQIFKGELNEIQTVLSNVEWGTGVDGFGLLSALKSQKAYEACETAADVAEVLAGFENDSEELDAFAEVVQNYLTLQVAGTSTENESPYIIPVTGDGYYFIKDAKEVGQEDAYTKIILQVVRDVQIETKADAPSLEKKIVEDNKMVDWNNGAVGDSVDYMLTSKVPEMDGYDKYFFVVHDSLSEGLSFEKDTVEVKIGTSTLSEDAYQVVTEKLEDGCDFEIVFKDFIQYKEQAGDVIQISYTATINRNAVIGNSGNTNGAHLEYSNNPNVTQNGDSENPDKPGMGDVTGTTPNDVTITYLTGIELTKIDDSETGIRLKGAEFTLKGEKLNQLKKVKGVFAEDENGTYYKLKDGTYTEIAPVEDTLDKYESTEIMYAYTTVTEWETVSEQITEQAMVGANGELHFHGLAAGTYVIEEMKAPDGYNLLEEPITVVITMEAPESVETGDEEAEWNYRLEGAMEQEESTAEEGVIKLSVVNKAGTVLPSTGGTGVVLFYIVGLGMAVAAIALNKRKKSMNA